MFKIRKVTDSFHPSNQNAIEQVFEIMRIQFPSLNEGNMNEILEQMTNPMKYKFSSTLFVAEEKKIIKAFLQRKYPDYCPEDHIKMVLASVKDNPVQLRDYKYIVKNRPAEKNKAIKNLIPSYLFRKVVIKTGRWE